MVKCIVKKEKGGAHSRKKVSGERKKECVAGKGGWEVTP